jgi:hypothetical protein
VVPASGEGDCTGEPSRQPRRALHAPADMWQRHQALLRRLPPLRTGAQSGGGLGCYYGSAPEGRKGKTAPLQVSSYPSPICDYSIFSVCRL